MRSNTKRFPIDFMFELTKEEWEQGVAMLSSVLNSDVAIEVNIGIMRAVKNKFRIFASETTKNKER